MGLETFASMTGATHPLQRHPQVSHAFYFYHCTGTHGQMISSDLHGTEMDVETPAKGINRSEGLHQEEEEVPTEAA
jgi:hypothetical protein